MKIEVQKTTPIGRILSFIFCVEDVKEIDFETFKITKTEQNFEITCKDTVTYFDLKESIERINTTKTHETVVIYEYDGTVKEESAIANIFFRLLGNPRIPVTVLDFYKNMTGRMTAVMTVVPPLIIEDMKWIPELGYCDKKYRSLVVRMLP